MTDDAEGLEKNENRQSHDNSEIYEKAVKILETYRLEEEDETMPPGDASQSAKITEYPQSVLGREANYGFRFENSFVA